MGHEKISKAYATSLYQLGLEKKVDIADELTRLTEVINANNNFETLLFSGLFTGEEKQKVLDEVVNKLNLSPLIHHFLSFLSSEKRIAILPFIYKDLIVLDDDAKGFLRGTIEGNDVEISEELKLKLTNYLEQKMGKKTQLDYIRNQEVTAGYRVTVGDLQLDASLDNQLNQFKETVLN